MADADGWVNATGTLLVPTPTPDPGTNRNLPAHRPQPALDYYYIVHSTYYLHTSTHACTYLQSTITRRRIISRHGPVS